MTFSNSCTDQINFALCAVLTDSINELTEKVMSLVINVLPKVLGTGCGFSSFYISTVYFLARRALCPSYFKKKYMGKYLL